MDNYIEKSASLPIYISESNGKTKKQLSSLLFSLSETINRLEGEGWRNLKVYFESTLEPHENCYPGPVRVEIRGERPMTDKELDEAKHQERINALAEKLGVTFYEAGVIDRAQASGKVQLKD